MLTRIAVRGSAFECGRQHGLMARKQVLGSRRVYAALFASVGIDWPTACARAWRFREPIADLYPALFSELLGIAAGSGLRLDEVLALNARTELLPASFPAGAETDRNRTNAVERTAGLPASLAEGECTSIAVAGSRMLDGNTRVAQNWDWIGAQRTHVLLVSVDKPDGASLTLITEAGMLAKIGFNQAGLAIGLNILRAVGDGARELGIPVHVFQRAALECATVAEVVALARHTPFAASSNAILGDATGQVGALEYSHGGSATVAAEDGVVLHTNHFCAHELCALQAPLDAMPTSEPRLARARAITSGWPARIGPEAIEALLADREGPAEGAIARRPDQAVAPEARVETVLGVVIDCVDRRMRVASGVPGEVAFAPVSALATTG